MPMNFKTWALNHQLKISKTGDWHSVLGKFGEIYEYQDADADNPAIYAVSFSPPSKTDKAGRYCPKTWNRIVKDAKASGFRVIQNGDSEGVLGFDPSSKAQVKMAIKIAKCRTLRELTPEARAILATRLSEARRTKCGLSCQR